MIYTLTYYDIRFSHSGGELNMSDAWEEIQAIKSKRNSLREKLQKRKKERQDILNLSAGGPPGKVIFYLDTLILPI